MGLFKKYFNQTRKPEGILGKIMINGMNGGHAKMAEWGMSFLGTLIAPHEIVDLGCGGGGNVERLLTKYPVAYVSGIDYSSLSVEKTKKMNHKAISEGRCTVAQDDVSDLHLEENKYDMATAFETIYFWPGLEKCFGQVAKILKPNGYFVIVNESDGMDRASLQFEKIIDGMKCYKAEEIQNALEKSGFSIVQICHHESKPWITVIARKKN